MLKDLLLNSDVVFFDDARTLQGQELGTSLRQLLPSRTPANRLCLLCFDTSIEAIALFAALIDDGYVPILMDINTPNVVLQKLIDEYRPSLIVRASDDGSRLVSETEYADVRRYMADDIAVFVPTSGSTGFPKLVALSFAGLVASARATAEYLKYDQRFTSTTSLPLNYSYGLSILILALTHGGKVYVAPPKLIDKDYWLRLKSNGVNIFSSVPSGFEMLDKFEIQNLFPSSFRVITVAGGKLNERVSRKFVEYCERREIAFFTMYGATEASPRMGFVPPNQALSKLGSAGKALSCGKFRIAPEFIDNNGREVGEVIYEGDNVAVGYVSCAREVAAPLRFEGLFYTGDLGYLDEDEFLFIVGRKNRNAKCNGVSLNLDHLENILRSHGFEIAAVGGQNCVYLFGKLSDGERREIKRLMGAKTSLGISGIKFYYCDRLPLTDSGKIDYPELNSLVENPE